MRNISCDFRTWFKNISLRKKLFFAYSFFNILLTLFVFIYFPAKFDSQALSNTEALALNIANMSAYSISPALYFNDNENIAEVLNNASQNKDIDYIIIHNSNNEFVKGINQHLAQSIDYTSTEGESKFSNNRNTLKTVCPIIFKDYEIGKLYLGLSLGKLNSDLTESRTSIAFISLGILIIAVVGVYLLSFVLTKPLIQIGKSFELIAEGDFSQRVIVTTNDEIGNLAISFNSMVAKLEKAYSELQEENQHRRKTEQELLIAKEELYKSLEQEKSLNQLKTKFISMVSHEYRTPLTIILSSTYLLDIFYQDQEGDSFKKQLLTIQSAVKNMTHMLDEVLVIGRADSGRTPVNLRQWNLVTQVFEVVQQTEIIDEGKHQFKFIYKNENCPIVTDDNLFKQALNNLVTNAVKYSPEGSTIEVLIIEENHVVKVSVRDQGIGIPESDMDFLFESFFRAGNVENRSGTGLGLAIVKRSLNLIKAKIDVKSKLNFGSVFTIELSKDIKAENEAE